MAVNFSHAQLGTKIFCSTVAFEGLLILHVNLSIIYRKDIADIYCHYSCHGTWSRFTLNFITSFHKSFFCSLLQTLLFFLSAIMCKARKQYNFNFKSFQRICNYLPLTFTVLTDYLVDNLITSDIQKRSLGFLAGSFIRPPLDVLLQFPCSISICCLVVDGKVGIQHSLGCEVLIQNESPSKLFSLQKCSIFCLLFEKAYTFSSTDLLIHMTHRNVLIA